MVRLSILLAAIAKRKKANPLALESELKSNMLVTHLSTEKDDEDMLSISSLLFFFSKSHYGKYIYATKVEAIGTCSYL